MQLRKLYRTVETIAYRQFDNEEDLLKHVLHEIVQNEEIHLKGGRTWKLEPKTGTYILLHQEGEMDLGRQALEATEQAHDDTSGRRTVP